MRHADVGSDHNLVVAKVLLKLRKAAIGTDKKRRYDVQKLKIPRIREEFNIALQNRFSVLQDEPDVTINQFHQALNEFAAKIIDHRKSVKAEWLTDDTWSIVEERKQAEREHFKRILNRPEPHALDEIDAAEADLDIKLGPITLGEVTSAIQKLKNGKAPGEDGVFAEMLSSETVATPLLLQRILQDIWETEDIPDDWKRGVIVKLPKKGDLADCNNWRGITLLPITSKVFCSSIGRLYRPEVPSLFYIKSRGEGIFRWAVKIHILV